MRTPLLLTAAAAGQTLRRHAKPKTERLLTRNRKVVKLAQMRIRAHTTCRALQLTIRSTLLLSSASLLKLIVDKVILAATTSVSSGDPYQDASDSRSRRRLVPWAMDIYNQYKEAHPRVIRQVPNNLRGARAIIAQCTRR